MDPALFKLSRLKNIGPKSEQWLNAIGVHTLDDLEELGAVAAFSQLKARGFPVTLNLVWAIEATVRGIHWRDLPQADKDRLKDELRKG